MKKWLLSLIVLIATFSFFLFLAGFIIGANDVINPKPSVIESLNVEEKKDPIGADGRLDIVGLGDSLTRGIGDSEGYGYLGRFVNLLKEEFDQEISLANLAVSGAKTTDVLRQLQDQGVQYSVAQADLIVLTIGGNDLNPGFDQLGEIDLTTYEPDVEAFTTNIRAILDMIRGYNQEAEIYWLSLYDPFERFEELEGSSENVLKWNYALEMIAIEYDDLFIIPTFDIFQTKTEQLLSKDNFHPNDQGYTMMAERLLHKVRLQLGSLKEGEQK